MMVTSLLLLLLTLIVTSGSISGHPKVADHPATSSLVTNNNNSNNNSNNVSTKGGLSQSPLTSATLEPPPQPPPSPPASSISASPVVKSAPNSLPSGSPSPISVSSVPSTSSITSTPSVTRTRRVPGQQSLGNDPTAPMTKKESNVTTTSRTSEVPRAVTVAATTSSIVNGTSHSPPTTTKVDQLLSPTAATNGSLGKKSIIKAPAPNSIRQKHKDQHNKQQPSVVQHSQQAASQHHRNQRSIRLTKRSSDGGPPAIDDSSLAESLFNFLLQPNANPSVGWRSSSSSFRELRRAQKQPLQVASASLDDLPGHPVYGYFSSPLLTNPNGKSGSRVTVSEASDLPTYANQLHQQLSVSSPSASNSIAYQPNANEIDGEDADSLVSSNLLNQVQLATLKKLENELLDQLINQKQQQQQIDFEKGSPVSQLPSLKSDSLLPMANFVTESRAKKNQATLDDEKQVNPYNYHRPLANAFSSLNSNSYDENKLLQQQQPDDNNLPLFDSQNGYSLNNVFLDPLQFSSLVSSISKLPKDSNFVSKFNSKIVTDKGNTQQPQQLQQQQQHSQQQQQEKGNKNDHQQSNDKQQQLYERRSSLFNSNVNRGHLEHQQQPVVSMDSSIDLPTIDALGHEPSSGFLARNLQQVMQPASLSHPLSINDLRHLIGSLTTVDDTFSSAASQSETTSKNDGHPSSSLSSPSDASTSSSSSSPPSSLNGQQFNRYQLPLFSPRGSIYFDQLISHPGSIFKHRKSYLTNTASGPSDADALLLLEALNPGGVSESILKKIDSSLEDADGDNLDGSTFLKSSPNELLNDEDVTNSDNLNPPGYVSLDDVNDYFSNVLLDDLIGSKSNLYPENVPNDVESNGESELTNDELKSTVAQFLESSDDLNLPNDTPNTIGVEGTPGFTINNVIQSDDADGDENVLLDSNSFNSIIDPLADEILRDLNDKADLLREKISASGDDEDELFKSTLDQLLATGSNSVKRNQVEEIKRLFTGSKRVDIKKPGPKLDWAEHQPVSKLRGSNGEESASSNSKSEDSKASTVKKAEGQFFRSASGGTTRQLGGRMSQLQQQQKEGTSGKSNNNLSPEEREEMKRDETIVLISLIVILVSITLILLTSVVYIVRRHELLRRKILHLLGRLDMSEPADDYKDLCRQRMAKKSTEVAASSVNPDLRTSTGVTASTSTAGAASASSGGNRKKKTSGSSSSEGSTVGASGRSSTSSWCEEPVASNMDISTGHMILSYMEDHLKNKDRLDREWQALLAYEADPSSTIAGQLAQNSKKNRYQHILPYDHSRVILNDSFNSTKSDYINANTITDHDPRNPAYIATQGPLANTVGDFWQMVWEQGSHTIVMLTRLMESGNQLCHRYWPEEGSSKYGSFEVHLVSEHIWCEDYLVRSLFVKNLVTNETRTVTQFHFLSWPEKSVPSSIKAILDFRRKANKSFKGKSCPTVVHCSDGCGRTGTYCLIDMVLNRMSKGAKEIDIAATLEHIRDQRVNMVRTKVQFEFVLKAVAEEVTAILRSLQNSNH